MACTFFTTTYFPKNAAKDNIISKENQVYPIYFAEENF